MTTYYQPGSIVEYQGQRYEIAGVSIGYPNGVETLNGYDLTPIGGGAAFRVSDPTQLTLISAPAPPSSPPPPTPAPQLTLAQENAKAAQQGYFDPGSIVAYQGAQYRVLGVSISYPGGVAHVNGHDIELVSGGPIVNGVPYSALTLVAPPPPQPAPGNPPVPPQQPAPPPYQPPRPPAQPAGVTLSITLDTTSTSRTVGLLKATITNNGTVTSQPTTVVIIVHPVQAFSYEAGGGIGPAGTDCTATFIPGTDDSQIVCPVPGIAPGAHYSRDVEVQNLTNQTPRYVQVSVTTSNNATAGRDLIFQ